jgi:malate dehydrogenase
MRITMVGGAGGVGSSTAFNVLRLDRGHEIVIVDPRAKMVASHVMDLEQVLEFGCSGSVREGSLAEAGGADLVVVAAGAPLVVNDSRLAYLAENAAILSEVGRLLAGGGWDGILLVVTNPVDPLCTLLRRKFGFDRSRLLGYTLNDSLRLRTGIAAAIGAGAGSVEAWAVGEHGDSSVPLFDRVRVDGRPVDLTQEQRAQADAFARTWYRRHVALDSDRSSTWTTGLGVARMISAIDEDRGELLTASVVLQGEYGLDGISVSVPVELGRAGARVVEWELAPDDLAALRRSADVVRAAVARIEAERGVAEGAARP